MKGKKIIGILSSIFLVIAFILIIVLWVISNNSFDMVVLNWGEYSTSAMYKNLEDVHKVRARESTFEGNSTLRVKLLTGKYDVVVPSQYMVNYLIENNFIEKLNWNYLSSIGVDRHDRFIETWNLINRKFKLKNGSRLDEYSVPYMIGDFKIAYNLTSPIVQRVLKDKNMIGSYQSIRKIVDQGGKLLARSSPRDFISLGLKANNKSINTQNFKDYEVAYRWLKPMMKNTYLNSDELATNFGDLNKWDVAFSYPGDYITGIIDEWSSDKKTLWNNLVSFHKPKEGSFIWSDVFVVQRDKNQNSSKFIERFTSPELQLGSDNESSKYYGGTEYIYYLPSNKKVYEGEFKDPSQRTLQKFYCRKYGSSEEDDGDYDKTSNKCADEHNLLKIIDINNDSLINAQDITNNVGGDEIHIYYEKKEQYTLRFFNQLLMDR